MRERFIRVISKLMAALGLICIMLADSDSKLPFIGLCMSVTWLGLVVIANVREVDEDNSRKSV